MAKKNQRLFSASIGVMAYNEEKNIGRFLDSLLSQDDINKLIHEIIIVSSGSTDKTNKITQEYAKKYNKIKLIKQNKRNGKASGVNTFIANAKKDILILASSDLILDKNTIKYLLAPLRKKEVGITGVHPIPVNNETTMMGYIAHLQWRLHHEIALRKPKMGEMIAFRKIFRQIPSISSVDEANIEPLIRGQGYKAVYCPKALVYNKGPENVAEFISRRRHIYFGHIVTKYEYGYEVSTLNGFMAFLMVFHFAHPSIRLFLFLPMAMLLETISRFLGLLDYKFRLRSHTVWKVTPSTKNLSTIQ
ncbi:MAG: glycosyltransferase [bacterium]|nr:glycosyltransferase [bacterium]